MEIKYQRKSKKRLGLLNNRTEIYNKFMDKFRAIYFAKFDIEELNDQMSNFLKLQLWSKGRILAFILEESKIPDFLKDKENNEEQILILTPFSSSYFNIYNYPTKLNAIALKGATFIPTKTMTNMVDCVVGFAHEFKCSIVNLIKKYVDELVEIEITLNINTFAHRLPRLVVTTPDNEERVAQIMNKIEEGEGCLFLSADDWEAIKNVLEGGANYIIDKLYNYKECIENEVLTILGINNVNYEKKERLITDEVNANNHLIKSYAKNFKKPIEDFCKNVENVLNYKLTPTFYEDVENEEVDEYNEIEEGVKKDDIQV